MLTVTFEQFLSLKPCWLDKKDGEERLKKYFKKGPLSALDILKFEDVTVNDKFWAIRQGGLLPAHILQEFECRCAERALSKIEKPDPRSIEAIKTKRRWMKGEATDEELKTAWNIARNAAWNAAWNDARDVACDTTGDTAWNIATKAAWSVVNTIAKDDTNSADIAIAYVKAEKQWQVEELIKMLEEVA